MKKNSAEKDLVLKNMLDSFIQSYAQRDTDMAFPDWLANRLRQELPEMELEASVRLAGDIIEAIAGYDQALHNLNQAIESGQFKEEWLSEQLEKAYEGMPIDAVGETLQRMEIELAASNMQLMGEIDSPVAEELFDVETEPVEWNEYSVRGKIYGIGQHLDAMAFSTAASALSMELTEEESECGTAVADALHKGLKAEVKAVVAGAVRVCAGKGLEYALPSDTPIEVIGDIAGVAVEGAEALYDAVNGDISMTAAMDKVGQAGVAAGCRIGAGYLKGWMIMALPYGPLVVDLLGGLFDHMETPQFVNNVYAVAKDMARVVKDAAKATWDEIKKSTPVKVFKELKQRLLG